MSDEIEVVVDLKGLTLGELAELEASTKVSDLIRILEPYVKKPPIRSLPVEALQVLAVRLQEQIRILQAAKN